MNIVKLARGDVFRLNFQLDTQNDQAVPKLKVEYPDGSRHNWDLDGCIFKNINTSIDTPMNGIYKLQLCMYYPNKTIYYSDIGVVEVVEADSEWLLGKPDWTPSFKRGPKKAKPWRMLRSIE